MADSVVGSNLGHCLRIAAAPSISTQLLRTAEFTVTRLERTATLKPDLIRIARENAFLIFVLRDSLPSNPYWIEGRPVTLSPRRPGQFHLLDLHQEHVAEIKAAVDCISLHLSCEALDVLAEEYGLPRVHTVKGAPGAAMDDPVVWHLSECLVPVLQRPKEANLIFVERVGLALGWHLICHYSEQSLPRPAPQGRLAQWQERRARELLMANLTGCVTLNELASACSLSRSHFARAFKRTFGVAPHQWLLAARINLAKTLLETSHKTIDEISEECGFADQSHLRRAFCGALRLTPAEWRRKRQQ